MGTQWGLCGVLWCHTLGIVVCHVRPRLVCIPVVSRGWSQPFFFQVLFVMADLSALTSPLSAHSLSVLVHAWASGGSRHCCKGGLQGGEAVKGGEVSKVGGLPCPNPEKLGALRVGTQRKGRGGRGGGGLSGASPSTSDLRPRLLPLSPQKRKKIKRKEKRKKEKT